MHGLIFAELKKYVTTKLGPTAWDALLHEANLTKRFYLTGESYPDAEAVALVTAASRITKQPANAILENFGEFIAPDLIEIYRSFIKPKWKTLDLIEHTEATIHKTVRLRDPGAAPPRLKTRRVSSREVEILYTSERKMCGVAKGIARGIAKHYGEQVEVTESTCMHHGAKQCTISVTLI